MLNFASKGLAANKVQGATDPNFANVSLLMHMDGTNGGTTFTDVKGNAVGSNQVSTDTSVKKFGTASAAFQATHNSNLQITNTTAFDFGSGDFTIEAWINCTSTGSAGGAILARWGSGPSTNADWILLVDGTGKPSFVGTNGAPSLTGPASVKDSTWHHIAIVRNGNNFTLYVDGTSAATTTSAAAIQYTAAQPLKFGIWNDITGSFYAGHMDEVRVTKGVARYTANFTPSDAPFPNQ
jgi:hypothetical protein